VALLLVPAALSAQDSARVVDRALQIFPVGRRVTLPAVWVGLTPDPPTGLCDDTPNGTVGDRVLTRREQFSVLPAPVGEWKKEFSAVVDSVMPFVQLVAQAGGDPWRGHCSALQMRVYVGDASIAPTDAQMEIARRVATRYFPATLGPTEHTATGWDHRSLSWNAFYYDYGGTAHVEFFARAEYGRTVVLVFMRSIDRHDRQLDAIVQSWAAIGPPR
jgi:hypothetical protein